MIQIFNLYKTYKGNTQALIDISLEIKSGEFIFLTGQSGAGKSTLLKILYSWENFDKGQILMNGINIAKIREDNQYTLRRKIGVVFQDYRLLPRKTVFENISFAQEAVESPSERIRFKTWEALKKVGLTQKKDSYPLQLAGGEQQRVAIARALINKPKIILADEPTGNLDTVNSDSMMDLLFEYTKKSQTSLVMVTHDNSIANRCDRIIEIKDGQIV